MLDTSHPMFRPLWFRLGLCAFLLGWTGLEWAFGNETWMMLVGIMGLIAVYKLLIEYRPPTDEGAPAQNPEPNTSEE